MSKIDNIKMENARIVFRNFGGKPDKFNPRGGNRQFSVVIDDQKFAEELRKEGWNLKQFRPREDSDEIPSWYLQVKVNFNNNPPHVYLVTGRNKTRLTEDTIDSLDYAEIEKVDVVITPYEYDVNGKKGVAAYCKTLYVNVVLDDFAEKYDFEDESEEIPFA